MESKKQELSRKKLLANYILNNALEKNYEYYSLGKQGRIDNATVVVSNITQYPLQINIILDGHGGDSVSDWVQKYILRLTNELFGNEFREEESNNCEAQHIGTCRSQEDRSKILYCENLINTYSLEELISIITKIKNAICTGLSESPYKIQHTGACISIAISQFDVVKNEALLAVGHLGDSSHSLLIKGQDESQDQVFNVNGFENLHTVQNLKNNQAKHKEFEESGGWFNKLNNRFNNNLLIYKALGDAKDMAIYCNQYGYELSFNTLVISEVSIKEIYLVGTSDGVNLDCDRAFLHKNKIQDMQHLLRDSAISDAIHVISPIRYSQFSLIKDVKETNFSDINDFKNDSEAHNTGADDDNNLETINQEQFNGFSGF